MDKRQPKCFHNGIILIVNSFKIVVQSYINYSKIQIINMILIIWLLH